MIFMKGDISVRMISSYYGLKDLQSLNYRYDTLNISAELGIRGLLITFEHESIFHTVGPQNRYIQELPFSQILTN
jgi:hypothetical protein